jgi:hypothetical protein
MARLKVRTFGSIGGRTTNYAMPSLSVHYSDADFLYQSPGLICRDESSILKFRLAPVLSVKNED